MESKELSLLKQNECSAMPKAAEKTEGVSITSCDIEGLIHRCA